MRTLAIAFLVVPLASGLVVACADDETARPTADPDSGTLESNDAGAPDVADARPPFDGAAPPIVCAVTPCITRIVAGTNHYCAIADDGVVRCWGRPTALGNFAAASAGGGATPVTLAGIGDVSDLAASTLRTCIAHTDGSVDCFGLDMPAPTRVANVTGATKLAVGDDRSCAVAAGGAVACWGDSASTGKGETNAALGGEPAASAAISATAAFVVSAKGDVYSWGADATMLGRDTPLSVDLEPGRVEGLPPAREVALSERHVCATTTDGRLFCWGNGDSGGLGIGSFRTVSSPTEVLFLGDGYPAQVAVALTHSCARMTDGSLMCWGRTNSTGVLGYSDTLGVFVPTRVSLEMRVAAVATGTGSTCILATDGSVWCWGDNSFGQLGIGARDADRHWQPTRVVFP